MTLTSVMQMVSCDLCILVLCCVAWFVFFLPSSLFSKDEFTTPTKLVVNRRPQRGTPITSTNFDASNELGDKIICYLPGGLVFFVIWIDSKLDERIMEVKVTEDGMGVVGRKKKPCPNSGGHIIDSMYSWAGDGSNFVVKQLDDEVNRLKEQVMTNGAEWSEELICVLREECLTDFVDIRGNPSGMVQYKQDSMGRQQVCFFLKTAKMQKKVAKAAVFETRARARSHSDGFGGMMDDLDDEETVLTQDYKEEVDQKMMQQQQQFATAMKQQQQQMDATAALLSQLMGQMQVNNSQQQQAAEQHAQQQQASNHQQQQLQQLQQGAAEYAKQQLLAKEHYDQQPAQPDKPGSS
jgi:hypothetical protein